MGIEFCDYLIFDTDGVYQLSKALETAGVYPLLQLFTQISCLYANVANFRELLLRTSLECALIWYVDAEIKNSQGLGLSLVSDTYEVSVLV